MMEQIAKKDEITAVDFERSEATSTALLEDGQFGTVLEEGEGFRQGVMARCHLSLEKSQNSLLCVLDEKNKTIELLRRQLHNQKIQLGHYLHRAFDASKILEISENCIPQVTEESIQLALAMNNFYKQTGLKSRLVTLHERMLSTDHRISKMVERQEALIRNIIDTLVDYASRSTTNDTDYREEGQNVMQLQLFHFFNKFGEFEIFRDMLNTTMNLRKELDTYRICCNRLIDIEDERNNIVEQVYSTPIEQRMNSNYIIEIQLEKRQLEAEIGEIREQQKSLENKVLNLTKMDDCWKGTQCVGDETAIDYQLQNVLDIVTSDAETILNTSQEQRESKQKFSANMEKLQNENRQLRNKIAKMESISQKRDNMESRLHQLENEYTVVIEDLQKTKNWEIARRNETISKLKLDMELLVKECGCLRDKVKILSEIAVEVETLRHEQEMFYATRLERDELKIQVENLQSIRSAYAQMVEQYSKENAAKCDWSVYEMEKEKLKDAELLNEKLSSKVSKLKGRVSSQELQIKHLLAIIEKLGQHNMDQNNNNAVPNEKGVENSQYTNVISKSAMKVVQKREERSVEKIKSEALPKNTCVPLNTPIVGSAGDTTYNQNPIICFEKEVEYEGEDNAKKNYNIMKLADKKIENQQTNSTSFEIFSTDKNGHVESIKAVLECSSPVEGVIRMEKLPNVSLKVKCAPFKVVERDVELKPDTGTTDKPANIDVFDFSSEINESELMKDCSEESLVITCPPCKSIHKQTSLTTATQENINITQICRTEMINIQSNPTDKVETIMPAIIEKVAALDATTSTSKIEDGSSNELMSMDLNTSIAECQIQSHEDCVNHVDYDNKIVDQLKIVESEISKNLSKPGGYYAVAGSIKSIYDNCFEEIVPETL